MQSSRFPCGIDDEFLCVACRRVLVDPVRLPCEDHEVCFACAETHTACPACHTAIPDAGGDAAGGSDAANASTKGLPRAAKTARLLAKMVVTCDFVVDGCAWTGPWSDLVNHRELHCACQPVACPYKGSGCPEVLERRAMPSHKGGCKFRASQCEYCLKVVRDVDLPLHIDQRCPQAPVSCQHCALPMARCAYERHLKEECAEGAVACPLAFIGCAHIGRRKETEAHLEGNAPHHLQTLIRAMGELKEAHAKEVADLRAELAATRSRVERIDLSEVERLRSTVEEQRVWLDRFAAGKVITVDPNGAGNFTTVPDAIAASSPGDAILIRPGTYDGAPVCVDKANVVLRANGDATLSSATGPALRLMATGASAEGLICYSTSPVASAVVVEAKECALTDVAVSAAALHGVQVTATSSVTLTRCSVKAAKQSAVEVRGEATLDGSRFSDTKRPVLFVNGGRVEARECVFANGQLNGAQVVRGGFFAATKCTFTSNGYSNIDVVGDASRADLVDCDIGGSGKCGICVADQGSVVATACTISENTLPNVAVLATGTCKLVRCTVEHGRSHGVVVKKGGACIIDPTTVVRDNCDTAVAREDETVVG
jgi:hypothetical protein